MCLPTLRRKMRKKLLVIPAVAFAASLPLAAIFAIAVVVSLFFGFKPDGTLVDTLMKF